MEERKGIDTEESGSRQQGHELSEKGNSPKLPKQPGPGTTTTERQLYMKGSAKENPHQIL